MLRTKLREAQNEPEALLLMLRGMDVLTRLVSAQYRLSAKAGRHVAEHLEAAARALRADFYGEEGSA